MSENRYYEFRSLDRPLDSTEMRMLRRLSTRATITPQGLTNRYEYGDFKGDVGRLMAETFDAFVYVGDYDRRFMLRLPKRRIRDEDALIRYDEDYPVSVREDGESLIVGFAMEEIEPDVDDAPEVWMQHLEPLRDQLLDGDLRGLYLGWLAAVEAGVIEDEALEPPPPPGLRSLNWPLRMLAGFLELDRSYIDAAAEGSPEEDDGAPRATGEIRSRRDALAEQRAKEAEERRLEQARRREEREAELRKKRLESLKGREEDIWDDIGDRIDTKRPSEYDLAVFQIAELRDLAKMTGTHGDFQAALHLVREEHAKKASFLRRLDEAGLVLDKEPEAPYGI